MSFLLCVAEASTPLCTSSYGAQRVAMFQIELFMCNDQLGWLPNSTCRGYLFFPPTSPFVRRTYMPSRTFVIPPHPALRYRRCQPAKFQRRTLAVRLRCVRIGSALKQQVLARGLNDWLWQWSVGQKGKTVPKTCLSDNSR